MFKVGEMVRKAGSKKTGVIDNKLKSFRAQMFCVTWSDGQRQVCKPSDMRELKYDDPRYISDRD